MTHRRGNFITTLVAGSITAALLLLGAASARAQSPVTPPGSGTATDPYLISELGHLAWMSNYTGINTRAKCYTMTADIDASATAGWNDAGTNTDIIEGFTPIGTSTTFFGGTFEGNGHTISGLVINRPATDDVGIFGHLGTAGKVRNLSLVNATITGASHVGGLVGCNLGAVSNCHVVGVIIGTGGCVGGLVGYHSGALSSCYRCYAIGTVTGQGNAVGGLIGANSGKVSSCFAANTVAGTDDSVGGLVGSNSGTLSDCFATGATTTTATESSVGGLVGDQAGTISNCHATGAVIGPSEAGGLVGDASAGTVSNSYWDIQTSGQNTSAGGTGKTSAQMKQLATWTGWDFATAWGIAEGTSYPYLQYSPPPFRLTINVSGPGTVTVDPASPDGTYAPGTVVTLTATPNTTGDGFLGWSGANPSDSLTVTIVLDAHKTVSALFRSWIELNSVADLARIGDDPDYPLANVSYRLTADIDASATATWNDAGTSTDILEGFKPIGSSATPFSGIFEGNGHTITGLVINRPTTDDVGLFASIGSAGQVRNLDLIVAVIGASRVGALAGANSGALADCSVTGDVTGKGDLSGGLVGTNTGTVSGCHATGTLRGVAPVPDRLWRESFGGLIGYNSGTASNCDAMVTVAGARYYVGGLIGSNRGAVSGCYATGTVEAIWDEVGGLVGRSEYGTVSNCFAIGQVTGSADVGGLIGYNGHTTVLHCYSTGIVTSATADPHVGGLIGSNNTTATVSDSYWDTQTSGLTTSAAGAGRTTAQMKQQATFTGWDFTNTWRIVENVTYPYLRSPADYGDFNHDGVIDRSDLDAFTACVTGPAVLYNPTSSPTGCTLLPIVGFLPADFDRDNDVDQSDFGIFQRCCSGPNLPADPNCAN